MQYVFNCQCLLVGGVPLPQIKSFTSQAGFEHIVSSDSAVANCAAAETRHRPAEIVVAAATAAVPSQRTNRH